MVRKPQPLKIVVFLEEETHPASIRHALRCLRADCAYLWRAVAGQVRDYGRKFSGGWNFKNQWWTRLDHRNQE
jgi:hypothetical protein